MSTSDQPDEATAAARPKRKRLLIVAAAALLLLAGGGGGAWYFTKPAAATTPAAPTAGNVVALDPISVNLNDGHYLKVGIALQATTDAATDPDVSHADDLAIDEFSGLTRTQLNATDLRDGYVSDLEKKIVAAYTVDGVEQVMGIYLTNFVMQ